MNGARLRSIVFQRNCRFPGVRVFIPALHPNAPDSAVFAYKRHRDRAQVSRCLQAGITVRHELGTDVDDFTRLASGPALRVTRKRERLFDIQCRVARDRFIQSGPELHAIGGERRNRCGECIHSHQHDPILSRQPPEVLLRHPLLKVKDAAT